MSPTSASCVAKSGLNDADRATSDDAKQPEVSASVDEAIRTAAKLAIDLSDRRARALLDLLDVKPQPASVTPLVVVRDRKP